MSRDHGGILVVPLVLLCNGVGSKDLLWYTAESDTRALWSGLTEDPPELTNANYNTNYKVPSDGSSTVGLGSWV